MKKGGFRLTKWASNSEELMKEIIEKERSPLLTVDLNQNESLKALGTSRDTQNDSFFFICAKGIQEAKDA